MLIYNHKKEFVGIDKRDLDALGFSDLSKLLAECNDFAELFVKTPGYIHDFKHVHWIDFITCAQSNEETKVIIHTTGKSYKASLHIDTIYLLEAPTQKAYSVTLLNLRELSKEESQGISDDILDRPLVKTPSVAPQPEEVPIETTQTQEIPIEDTYEIEDVYEETPEIIEDVFDQEPSQEKLELDFEEIQEQEDDFKLDLDDIHTDTLEAVEEPLAEIDIAPKQEPIKETTQAKASTSQATVAAVDEDDDFDYNYVYDPHVASEELGLPLDLIEEFIQDFINQAYEFKDELYESLDKGALDNVRILSHKLKGVAANLRIEDAFDVLVTVNTSDDLNKVLLNLNRFYKIIAKLAGEEVQETQNIPLSPSATPNEESFSENENIKGDDFTLDFKEEESQQAEPELQQEDDDFALDFKDDLIEEKELKNEENDDDEEDLYLDYSNEEALENEAISIDDSAVPEKIEIPELADDDFVHTPDEDKLSVDLEEESFMEDIEPLDLPLDIDEAPLELEQTSDNSEYHSSYNKSLVASEIGLSKESFNELFNDYIQDSKELLSDLESALANEDQSQYKKAAMKLKGMSDNMRIQDFKQELETLITSEDTQSAKEAIETIKLKLNSLSKIED